VERIMAITATEARKRLFPLIEEVNNDQQVVEILSKGGTAFLVPEEQWRRIQETLFLMSDPQVAGRLRKSIAQAEAGLAEQRELIDPDV
jgi:antitoxin YefM